MIDETVDCGIAYEKEEEPGVTFVECHRSWEKVGLPILNFLGVLNLALEKKLAQLRVGEEVEGERRPDDFNTVTVAISSSGRVVAVNSNIRWIVSAITLNLGQLLTPEQALREFMSHKAELSLTIPEGAGFLNFARVYPGNLARAKEAVITDYLLTFLEMPFPFPMEELIPVYLIRGWAVLSSGYRVRFAEVVPALAGKRVFTWRKQQGEVAGQSIKLGTFTPVPSPSPTPLPTPSLVFSPTATPRPTSRCKPSFADLNPVYELSVGSLSLGKIGVYKGIYKNVVHGYYYVPPEEKSFVRDLGLKGSLQLVFSKIEEMSLSGWNVRKIIEEVWTRYWYWSRSGQFCPLRMTGASPTIFVYLKEAKKRRKKLKIEVGRELVFSEPAAVGGEWEIKMEGGKIWANGKRRDYLYYEYKLLSFAKPKKGWVIEREKLEEFVREELSPALCLRRFEEERLVFEFKHASFGMMAKYVFVGLIPQEEVEKKIPLKVSPKPELVVRRHFYLAPLPSMLKPQRSFNFPEDFRIPRREFMVLELGALRGVIGQ